jgi:hypothetical protein
MSRHVPGNLTWITSGRRGTSLAAVRRGIIVHNVVSWLQLHGETPRICKKKSMLHCTQKWIPHVYNYQIYGIQANVQSLTTAASPLSDGSSCGYAWGPAEVPCVEYMQCMLNDICMTQIGTRRCACNDPQRIVASTHSDEFLHVAT